MTEPLKKIDLEALKKNPWVMYVEDIPGYGPAMMIEGVKEPQSVRGLTRKRCEDMIDGYVTKGYAVRRRGPCSESVLLVGR